MTQFTGQIEAVIPAIQSQIIQESLLGSAALARDPSLRTRNKYCPPNQFLYNQTSTQNIMIEPETKSQEWWASFPAVRSTPPSISADEVMKLFDDMDITPTPRTFLLVDVRRTDWEGGTIRTSLNLPAQSFYQTRKTLFDLLERGGFKMVIFYCGELSFIKGQGERTR